MIYVATNFGTFLVSQLQSWVMHEKVK